MLHFAEVWHGLLTLFTVSNMALMFLGILIGFVFGVIPGLSGIVALTLLLPLIYGMDPTAAMVFLLSAHAIVSTGGSITAILLGIPGTEPNAATIIDGFPMARQGRGGRALGAALTSSLLGGVFGALVLALLIPLILPIALAFKSPELFLLIILGLLCIAVLSKGSLVKGLVSGSLGLVLSLIGFQGLTAMQRFTFGSLYLYDGIKLIPLGLGLFAIPVILDLAAKGTTIAQSQDGQVAGSEILEGVKDAFRHRWLLLRCSAIGAWMGILPGVGGTVATFIAYGHARETSRNRDNFGQGEVEGVIGPEAANNAKEGGALLPTLVLGLPGSGAMAILLGAFLMVGLEPGPFFLVEHMDIGMSMLWTLVVANAIAAAMGLLFCKHLSKIAFIRGHVLAPFLLAIVFFGAYSYRGMFLDVVVMLIFGALGFAMEALKYNRPALLLGFILGSLAEKYFFLSLRAHGPWFFFSSYITVILLVLILLVLSMDKVRHLLRTQRSCHDR